MARTAPVSEIEIPVETVPAMLDRAAALSSGDALVMGDERLTYPELAARTRTMARRLLGAGVRHGDRVGVLHDDTVDAIALLLGAMYVGAIPIPVNGRYKEHEINYVAGHAGMRLFVVDPRRAQLVGDAGIDARVVVGIDDPAFVAGGEAVDPADVEAAIAAVRPRDDVIMLYTSGTTANPKGCLYSHHGLTYQGFNYGGGEQLTQADRFYTPLPFFHVSAIVIFAATIAYACPLVHVGVRFDPASSSTSSSASAAPSSSPASRRSGCPS